MKRLRMQGASFKNAKTNGCSSLKIGSKNREVTNKRQATTCHPKNLLVLRITLSIPKSH